MTPRHTNNTKAGARPLCGMSGRRLCRALLMSALIGVPLATTGCGATQPPADQEARIESTKPGTIYAQDWLAVGRSTRDSAVAAVYRRRITQDVERVIETGGRYVLTAYTGNANRGQVVVDTSLAPPDGGTPGRAAKVAALRNGTRKLVAEVLGVASASDAVKQLLTEAHRDGSDAAGALDAALDLAQKAPSHQAQLVRVLDDGLQRDERLDISRELARGAKPAMIAHTLRQAITHDANGVEVAFSGLGLTAAEFEVNQSRIRDTELAAIYEAVCRDLHAKRCDASAS